MIFEYPFILDRLGVKIGHYQSADRPTGCTVCLCPHGAVAGVSVVGAAPGTRETDLLSPSSTVGSVHGIVLSGGSAFGLDAASGVMRWLAEHGFGLLVGPVKVPIVPAAVLFDLWVDDFAKFPSGSGIHPDARAGYEACEAAMRPTSQFQITGNVGAGYGATVGKLNGNNCAMRGGLGFASMVVDGFTVAAIIACNAVGDVVDPDTGKIIAGARKSHESLEFINAVAAELHGFNRSDLHMGSNTTIGVIMTDAKLSKAEAQSLARIGHDGLARTIRPVHTSMDGDTLFTLSTGKNATSFDMMVLMTAAAEVTAQAVLVAARSAEGLHFGNVWWPSAKDLATKADHRCL